MTRPPNSNCRKCSDAKGPWQVCLGSVVLFHRWTKLERGIEVAIWKGCLQLEQWIVKSVWVVTYIDYIPLTLTGWIALGGRFLLLVVGGDAGLPDFEFFWLVFFQIKELFTFNWLFSLIFRLVSLLPTPHVCTADPNPRTLIFACRCDLKFSCWLFLFDGRLLLFIDSVLGLFGDHRFIEFFRRGSGKVRNFAISFVLLLNLVYNPTLKYLAWNNLRVDHQFLN